MSNLKFFGVTMAALTINSAAWAFTPVAPSQLTAEVNGMSVKLSWQWGNETTPILATDFEEATFPAEGWAVKSTYDFVEGCTWRLFDCTGQEEDYLVSSGKQCVIVQPAGDYDMDNLSTAHQDEWLTVSPGVGAVYLEFNYFLHPELKEVGGYEQFPDHYYVKISRDNGVTWTELWDGRWDMGSAEGVQHAALFLGEPTDEQTVVAFQALSGPEDTLYFLWSLDDITFSAAAPVGRALSQDEWLNSGGISYRVTLDDEPIHEYVKALTYTDNSDKKGGRHTYRVMAWEEASGIVFDSTSVEVDIPEFTCPPVRELTASYRALGADRYEIIAEWSAPDGPRTPTFYEVYVNGKSIGRADNPSDLSIGQTGLYRGVYTFEVEAVYEMPSGKSERVSATIAPGTIMPPLNLVAAYSAGAVNLQWDAPDEADVARTYAIYRGDELLSTKHTTTYRDTDPCPGVNNYSVHILADDGNLRSLPAEASVDLGEFDGVATSLEETFDNGHLPLHWTAEIVDPYERVKTMYCWRFDNWFDSSFDEACGLVGGFASVSGQAAGMNRLETHLTTPPVVVDDGMVGVIEFTDAFSEPKAGPSGPAKFMLRVSIDGGVTWTDRADLVDAGSGTHRYVLSPTTGATVMARWSFLGRNSGTAAVDNVRITSVSPASLDAVEEAEVSSTVYTLDGRQVDGNSQLAPGIYINSRGRKIIVK